MTHTSVTPPVSPDDIPSETAQNVQSFGKIALGLLSTWLINNGVIAQDQAQAFTSAGLGVLGALATVVWIVWHNKSRRALAVAALNSRPPAAPAK